MATSGGGGGGSGGGGNVVAMVTASPGPSQNCSQTDLSPSWSIPVRRQRSRILHKAITGLLVRPLAGLLKTPLVKVLASPSHKPLIRSLGVSAFRPHLARYSLASNSASDILWRPSHHRTGRGHSSHMSLQGVNRSILLLTSSSLPCQPLRSVLFFNLWRALFSTGLVVGGSPSRLQ